MNLLKKFTSNTSLIVKIIVPIFILGVASLIISSTVIEKLLKEHILNSEKIETKNVNTKLYYLVESDFKTLFFNHGNLAEDFDIVNEIAKKETINSLLGMFKKTSYESVIITPTHNIWLKRESASNEDIKKLQLNKNRETKVVENREFIISISYFKPWNWYIVVFKDKSSFKNLVKKNNTVVSLTILSLMVLIVITLYFILKLTIDIPFVKIFKHLEEIKEGKFNQIKLSTSLEIVKLINHINSMTNKIYSKQQELIKEREKTQKIIDSQSNIVIVTDGKQLQIANQSFFNFFDEFKTIEEFLKKHDCLCDYFEVVEDEEYIYKKEGVDRIDEADNKKALIIKNYREYIFSLNVNNMIDSLDKTSFVISLTDITELEKYKKQLEVKKDDLTKQLYTDSLTLLPNRIKLIEDIKKSNYPFITLINIDSFKEVNDFYGVEIGDYVLIEFAKIIDRYLPTRGATLYKLSADEYAIFDDKRVSKKEIAKLTKELSFNLNKESILKNDYEISFSTTLGSALLDKQNILINADIALRTAKKDKYRYVIYDDSLQTLKQFESNILWNKKIKAAISKNSIVPYFQAIIDNKSLKISKYECLVRLFDEHSNLVVPYVFLKIAKKSHIYHKISEVMIRRCFEYFKDKNDISFSINISVDDIKNRETYHFILNQLEKTQIGDRVVFELLESEGIENYDIVLEFIEDVKRYNSKIAIDDFGTGYSNFNHLLKLKIDYLKIDGSLIKHILLDKHSKIVVETIVNFAKKLNIKTIAEYVDTKELLNEVTKIGIDYSQGYIVSKPSSQIFDKDFEFKI